MVDICHMEIADHGKQGKHSASKGSSMVCQGKHLGCADGRTAIHQGFSYPIQLIIIVWREGKAQDNITRELGHST